MKPDLTHLSVCEEELTDEFTDSTVIPENPEFPISDI